MPSSSNHLRLILGEAALVDAGDPLSAMDDTQLLAALRAGDATAAGALYNRTHRIVERTVRRLLGAREVDREDLCQLAFIELVNTIERFRGDCPLDAWVSVVTARVVYKHLRRRKLERRIFTRIPLDVIVDTVSPLRETSVIRDLLRRVRGHLERIDEGRALTFLLHDAYGYDLKEIAQITGVSVAAAQSRLVRGRRELHERIAGDASLHRALDDLPDSRDS